MELQELLDRTLPGQICHAEGREYVMRDKLSIRSKTLQCSPGTVIRRLPTDDREGVVIRVDGINPQIIGGRVIGGVTSGGPFDESREGQHGIRVDGALSPMIADTAIQDTHGDSIYIGTKSELAHETWTRGATITSVTMDGCRHAVTVNAGINTKILDSTVGHCILGVFDVEPPGGSWGAITLAIRRILVLDRLGGFVFANKGQGRSDTVHDIWLDQINCRNRPFTASINPPPGVRRSLFRFTECRGSGVLNHAAIVARQVDDLTVRGLYQEFAKGVQPVEQHDCRRVLVVA